jgi:membrane-bound lytic murein transglycosylase B
MTRDYEAADGQLVGFAEVERKRAPSSMPSRPAERLKAVEDYRTSLSPMRGSNNGVVFWKLHEETLAAPRLSAATASNSHNHRGKTSTAAAIPAVGGVMDTVDYSIRLPASSPLLSWELREFLLLTVKSKVEPLSLKGSYASAMGLPRLYQAAFSAYAVDLTVTATSIWTNQWTPSAASPASNVTLAVSR